MFGGFRRRWFPTKEERYADGRTFAERHFANVMNEAEFEMLYEALPLEPRKDPFDKAIMDYAQEVRWGAR